MAALAVGQTLIILTAGIDLSVGAIAILATMVMATLAADERLAGAARTGESGSSWDWLPGRSTGSW